MTTINTKFGKVYLEEWNPFLREEEERVKIYDSRKRYLDYVSAEFVEDIAEREHVSPQEILNRIADRASKAKSFEDMLYELCVGYDFIAKTPAELVDYMLDANIDDDGNLEDNDCVNKIGDFYVLVF